MYHMGPQMNAITQESSRQIKVTRQVAIPPGLVDVAYIDGGECSAAAAMSLSQWHALVKDGKAPSPAIRKPRFTRWLMSDVRDWLIQYRTQADSQADSARVIGVATRASQAAQAKRKCNQLAA
jgi:predicted DNA-binding transcriptional regulator AlpA